MLILNQVHVFQLYNRLKNSPTCVFVTAYRKLAGNDSRITRGFPFIVLLLFDVIHRKENWLLYAHK